MSWFSSSSKLVIFPFLCIFRINRVKSNLFIILLQSCKILSGLRKLPLFHPLPNIPEQKP